MEYIDNSLDSADQNFFDRDKNRYKKPIEITFTIIGDSQKEGSVIITDNCFGITNLPKVVQSIGNSDKKAQPWTNGQFGYGIYSFMAACEKLEILTRLEGESAQYIPIYRTQFSVDRQEDVSFPDPKRVSSEFASGTMITLSNFDRDAWKQIDLELLRNEIEKHFELVLRRENLTVKLATRATAYSIFSDKQGDYICRPFDYSSIEGDIYQDSLNIIHLDKKSRGRIIKKELILGNPVNIFLKVTKGRTIGRAPVFVLKGRRICEVREVRSFKSNHKSDVWGHPNLTGYVDLKDWLQPTIARNDFVNSDTAKGIYSELIKLEPVIEEVLKQVNRDLEDRHYRGLELRLNEALAKLAAIDAMRFKSEFSIGTQTPLAVGSEGARIDEKGEGTQYDGPRGEGTIDKSDDPNFETKGSTGGELPSEPGKGTKPSNREDEKNAATGNRKKSAGFDVRIVDREPDIDAETDKPIRSQLVGGTIQIFKLHPEFEARVHSSRKGEKQISSRLLTYLAGEITVHYKDLLYKRSGQPEYNKNHLINLVEFVYLLEDSLADLAGKNLSVLS